MRNALLAITLLALPVSTRAGVHAQAAGSELTGRWRLIPAASDSVDGVARDAENRPPRPPGTVRVGVGRAPTAGFPGGFGQPRGFDPQLMRDAAAAVSEPREQLSIALNGDTLTLVIGDAAPYAILLNGRKAKRPWIDGVDAELKATRKDGELRIERKTEDGLKFTERYVLDARSGRMIVTMRVDGPIPRSLERRWQYERAGGG